MSRKKHLISKVEFFKIEKSILSTVFFISFFIPSTLAFPRSTSTLISSSPKEVIDQVWQIIYRDHLNYSGDYSIDTWIVKRKTLLSNQYQNHEESYDAIRGMLKSLNDPYTRFLDPKEFNEMIIDTSGELMGIGIQISLDKETKDIVVVAPIEGTPAFNAGIKPKDVIISIDGELTKGMKIDNAVKLIRGKKGTNVVLELRRDNELIKVNLLREKISIKAVDSHINKTEEGFKIGYVRLKQFNANSVKEMKRTINVLERKEINAYVLDLRGNPGGLLEASIEIARQWLNEGIIVSTKTKDGINEIRKAKGRALTTSPIAVLINEGSASASEILSGAIQDNKRGILVGKKTFGKGLVQSVRSLADGSGLTVTVAKYLTPNGRDINQNGIFPDIEVDLDTSLGASFSYKDLGTNNDSQYIVAENALVKELLKIRRINSYIPGSANLNFALSPY